MESVNRQRLTFALIVVLAWVLVALAWTPPTIMVQQYATTAGGAFRSNGAIFLDVLCGFVPWMAATPLIFWLGRRFPITENRIAAPLAIHVLAGIVIVPATVLIGTVLAYLVVQQQAIGMALVPRLIGASLITAFYTIPTYIAVVAIGQAMGYFQRYRLRERLLARAELRALQAQINPHFLFNTLNAISALLYRDPKQADAAIAKLSELLRHSLKERAQEIPLREEIGFARNYLELCDMLIAGPVHATFTAAPEAWDALVPSLLLQPLFENAIVHGLSRRKGGGELAFAARVAIDTLVLTLRNDAADSPEQAQGGNGIGLSNVRERLAVLYGRHQSLELEDVDGGTMVHIKLPFREAGP